MRSRGVSPAVVLLLASLGLPGRSQAQLTFPNSGGPVLRSPGDERRRLEEILIPPKGTAKLDGTESGARYWTEQVLWGIARTRVSAEGADRLRLALPRACVCD